MRRSIYWFLKEDRVRLAAEVCVPALFLAVFRLYGLNMSPFYYAAALYLTMWLTLTLLRFNKVYKMHLTCLRLADKLKVGGRMPEICNSQAEEDFGGLINALADRIAALTDARINDQQEASAYYTMWVHQIKTPIAAMRMLLQTEDTETSRRLQNELFRIDSYAEMALGYIRLDESGNDLDFETCSLDRIIRASIRKYAPQFISRKLAIHYEQVDIDVMTDEKWLSFIIEQLLSNAVKYTREGSVTISVTADKMLIVQDTGIGIPKEDLPRVFEKGFTGTNGRIDKRATGLGLYLCRRAADKLDIGLSVESEPGRGTRFMLKLGKKPMGQE